MTPGVRDETILANLTALHAWLAEAATLAAEACEAMRAGQRNLAIGTRLPFEQTWSECDALFRTALLLHRSMVTETQP